MNTKDLIEKTPNWKKSGAINIKLKQIMIKFYYLSGVVQT